MKKRLISLLSLLLLILMVLPAPAAAITPLDTAAECSMTLHYAREGV
jgi:hypothetical protein